MRAANTIASSAEPRTVPALKVSGLGVEYGALVALKDVSWEVYPGELLGIIGPNGAGKSSCYNATTSMVKRSGQVFLHGVEVSDVPPHGLAELGLKRAFQQNAFFSDLTVLQNYEAVLGGRAYTSLLASICNPFAAARRLHRASSYAARQLVRFGIPERYHGLLPGDLPYGVQRMLSIALAYGAGASVLLLDEPAAGLGGEDMTALIRLLSDLKHEGVALVVIEHHMDLIMTVADHICVLDLGRQIAFGTPGDIQNDARVLEAYLGSTS